MAVGRQQRDGGEWEIRLVGPLSVARDGRQLADAAVGSRKARTVLALLAVDSPAAVPVDRLIDAVWPTGPPRGPAENLATMVSRLRAALDPAVVVSVPGGYRLGDGAARGVDLVEAAALLRTARARTEAAEPAPALAAARRALELLGDGAVLTDQPDAEWATPARAEAARLLRAARHGAATAALALLDAETAAAAATAAVEADPLDETGSRLLMRAYQLAAEPARALAEYGRLRAALADELGAEPAAEARAVHAALLRDQQPEGPTGSLRDQQSAALSDRQLGTPSDRQLGALSDQQSAALSDQRSASLPEQRSAAPSDQQVGARRDPQSGQPRGRQPAAGDPPPRTARVRPVPGRRLLVGREAEETRLADLWSATTAGTPGFVLLMGAAGLGKTRLATEVATVAAATGGRVLQARCYGTERSLFLQPLADAVRPVVTGLPAPVLAELAGDDPAALAAVAPDLEAVLGPAGPLDGGPDVRLRRAFAALAAFLRGLARRGPVLLVLDDLQEAGRTTVDFLHHLARHSAGAPLLVLAVARSGEGDEAAARLADVATTLPVQPLTPAAVGRLAADAGRPELADELYRRTRGHTLFVVETLRGLAAGEPGIPGSLRDAVLARVARLGPETEEALRAASVLGPPFDPGTLAGVLGIPGPDAVRRCERALHAALLAVAGDAYEFVNDLVQEVLYATTPAPTRVHHHRQAADILADRPEAAAVHAAAAGQPLRAARAWLQAGEESLRRWAAPDAEAFLDRALTELSTVDDPGRVELSGRLHLARGRAREARGAFDTAWADHQEAVALAREAGDQRLEMAALRQLGGDVPIGQGRSIELCVAHLEAGVRIARGLGDRASEADLLGRLAVVCTNQLRFDLGVRHGTAAVATARATAEPAALAAALDGLKTAYAYLGDVTRLQPVLVELEPLLRAAGDLWRLQWAVLESAFPAIARGEWEAALDRIAAARTLNRRSRFGSYESWFVVHGGWVERLRGHSGPAVAAGREAVAVAARDGSRHPWWPAAAHAFLGATLLAGGDRAGAVPELEASVRMTSGVGAGGYLLRGLAPLAEATGDRDLLIQADELLAGVTAPAGGAWLLGADVYLAVARAWLAAGAPDRAQAVLDRFLPAADAAGWPTLVALGTEVAAACATARGDRAAARRLAERAAVLAARYGVALAGAQTSSASRAAARAAAPGSTGR
jgi:DNA-binding SARP family transcriptional activator